MAAATGTGAGVCKGCGGRRGVDHCVFPSKQGPKVTDPNHPMNNGTWDAYWKQAMKDKKIDPNKPSLTEAQLKAVVLYPNKSK